MSQMTKKHKNSPKWHQEQFRTLKASAIHEFSFSLFLWPYFRNVLKPLISIWHQVTECNKALLLIFIGRKNTSRQSLSLRSSLNDFIIKYLFILVFNLGLLQTPLIFFRLVVPSVISCLRVWVIFYISFVFYSFIFFHF